MEIGYAFTERSNLDAVMFMANTTTDKYSRIAPGSCLAS